MAGSQQGQARILILTCLCIRDLDWAIDSLLQPSCVRNEISDYQTFHKYWLLTFKSLRMSWNSHIEDTLKLFHWILL